MKKTLLIIILLAMSCTRQNLSLEDNNTSHLNFLTFGEGVYGLIQDVRKQEITACLSGSYDNFNSWENRVRVAILKWVDPLRDISPSPLANNVLVREGQGGNCDVDVVIHPSVHAHTNIGSHPVVNMSASGYFASDNVLTHEFGHAFALADTYQGGQSGNCQAGQPQSLMCNTSYSAPQADDIKGIYKKYQELYSDASNMNSINPRPESDYERFYYDNNEINDQEPGITDPNQFQGDFYVALGDMNSSNTAPIYLNYATNSRNFELWYCEGNQSNCNAPHSDWYTANAIKNNLGDRVFKSQKDLSVSELKNLTLGVLKGNRNSGVKEIKLKRK